MVKSRSPFQGIADALEYIAFEYSSKGREQKMQYSIHDEAGKVSHPLENEEGSNLEEYPHNGNGVSKHHSQHDERKRSSLK